MFRSLVMILATILLAACKVELVVPEQGRVASASGTYDCEAGQSCSVDVLDQYFEDTFTALPQEDYIFSGWKTGFNRLCGGSVEACALSTTGFGDFEVLMDILASDATFYLEPTFLPVDTIRIYRPGNRVVLSGTLIVEQLALPAESAAVRASLDILEGIEALEGKNVLGLRTTLTAVDSGASSAVTSQFWQEVNGALVDLTDDEGYYYWDISTSNYGIERIPVPLVAGSRQVLEYYLLVPGHTFGPLATGTRSIVVGEKEEVEVPMGTYEAQRVTVSDNYTFMMSYADHKRDSSVHRVRTFWISPARGVIKIAARDQQYSTSGKLELTRTLGLEAVRTNF